MLFINPIVWCGKVYAQKSSIDSLLLLLTIDKPDSNKVNHLNRLSREYINNGEYSNGLKYGNKALALASSIGIGNGRGWAKGIANANINVGNVYFHQDNYIEALIKHETALRIWQAINDKQGIAASNNYIASIYINQGRYVEALKNYEISLEINKELGDKKGIAESYNKIGLIYQFQGNYPEALKKHFAAYKIMEEINNKPGLALSYTFIANDYYSQGNFDDALKNYLVVLKIKEEIGDKQSIAVTRCNIGNIYGSQGNYSEALINYKAGLKTFEEAKSKQRIATTYNNIGAIYELQGNYSEALKNDFIALKIMEDIRSKSGIVSSLLHLGDVHTKLHKLKEARDYLIKAMNLSKEIGFKERIKNCYSSLARLDSIQSNWKSAYEHYKQFIVYRDSINNEETKKKIIESTMTFEFEKKEAEAQAEQVKKDAIEAANKKRQQIVLILVSCVLLLVFIFAAFVVRSLRFTQKQKIIIEEKNKLVEEKNKDIIDSINYAKRIQDALLKEEDHITEHLPAHFVLFKPKDIVSGDFHWSLEKNGYWFLAAVDCTGHGVPGAFMSMLGIAFLNEITAGSQLNSPAEILDLLRDKVVKELGQTGKEGQSKDGMDISLIRLDLETKELQWAGANNPLYIIENSFSTENNSKVEFIEIKANKQPIGYHLFMQPFTNHTIQLAKGATFYLFTDGYADQFGGGNGKKLKYSKLKDLLLSLNDKSMPDHKKMLDETFENWKGTLDQVDDICVIGVKV